MSRRILLSNGILIDTKNNSVSQAIDILIENDFIKETGHIEALSNDNLISIDCSGKYFLPGLFDCHTHLSALVGRTDEVKQEILEDAGITEYPENSDLPDIILKEFVKSGITQLRDCGGPLNILKDIKDKIKNGNTIGPDIFYAGPMLEREPLTAASMNETWPGWTMAVNDKNDADNIVRELKDNGASLVKTFGKFDHEILRHLINRAKDNGLPLIHDPGPTFFHQVPVDVGISLGIDCFEHAKSLWQATLKDKPKAEHDSLIDASQTERQSFVGRLMSLGAESISFDKLHRLLSEMREKNIYFCPTLHIFRFYSEKPEVFNDKEPEKYGPIFGKLLEIGCEIVSEAAKQKVKILVGQDGYIPRFTSGEMNLLKDTGLSEPEIIRGATAYPSEWLGVANKYGTIEPGKMANLVVLNKNPLEDIKNIESVDLVLNRGEISYRVE